jgi:hypothetical protein
MKTATTLFSWPHACPHTVCVAHAHTAVRSSSWAGRGREGGGGCEGSVRSSFGLKHCDLLQDGSGPVMSQTDLSLSLPIPLCVREGRLRTRRAEIRLPSRTSD